MTSSPSSSAVPPSPAGTPASGSGSEGPSPGANTSAEVASAAAAAVVCAKALLHPLDTIKCRLQVLGPADGAGGLRARARQLWRRHAGRWGPRWLYGGLPARLALYAPYEALYMTSYEGAQGWLRGCRGGSEGEGEGGGPRPRAWHAPAAAVFAELCSCVIRVPMETIKMRVQSAAGGGTAATVRHMRAQGWRACARLALPQTLVHDIPYGVTQWVVYEAMRERLAAANHRNSAASADSLFAPDGLLAQALCSGGFAGLAAAAVTVPLDNVRTRTVVATAADPSLGVRQVVAAAYRQEGARAFVRGGAVRVLWVSANMAVYFPLFEGLKALLRRKREEGGGGCGA